MAEITKMNVTACHAPWQTESDWYMVGAHGDGCDFIVVRGWTRVVSAICDFFINGTTIEAALNSEVDAAILLDLAREWADEDRWQITDNAPDRRPHVWESEIGECAHAQITLLTEPPRVAA